ncbi:gem-associated protein 8 isoform X1 [Nycticebus coucang]|uniref:gem-associated protein 8 isoform X1 n=2 Tax=Nycticebus coucang TaxID=9470 RepID=UPI00234D3866|nr:gem-associated protein 8 isoform X1 [Nycticebus coucang]XP_053436941.1 gem-associated protein 8 isoform X1 [Nycticebus coucang]
MAAQASTSKASEYWYSHPAYARYWQHYHQAMAWMRNHQNAYRKAMQYYFSFPWHLPSAVSSQSSCDDEARDPQSFGDHHLAQQDHHWGSHFRRSRKQRHVSRRFQVPAREDQTSSEDEEVETESDGGIECDLSNMVITEELRQYFAETERHREERRRQQQLDAQRLNDYVNADHDLHYNPHRSVKPPTERPGERRKAEMKRLYGDSAAKIQAMEAAVQLSFDKHCDRKQPKYWPVIPLKF